MPTSRASRRPDIRASPARSRRMARSTRSRSARGSPTTEPAARCSVDLRIASAIRQLTRFAA